jgi:hypothetical protein
MTEAEWLSATSFLRVYKTAEAKLRSGRKARLFCVACCRRYESHMGDPRCLAVLDAAERLADGALGREGLAAARKRAAAASRTARRKLPAGHTWTLADAAEMSVRGPRSDFLVTGPIRVAIAAGWLGVRARDEEDAVQVGLLRDLFGNPFRKVKFDKRWRTDTAVALAQHMYESRDFGVMPILADALQEAGCDSEDILVHCRGPGPHVRGCWVVDLVLGKE